MKGSIYLILWVLLEEEEVEQTEIRVSPFHSTLRGEIMLSRETMNNGVIIS
jgi:hypothetical protein